jgi:hypothetical protein
MAWTVEEIKTVIKQHPNVMWSLHQTSQPVFHIYIGEMVNTPRIVLKSSQPVLSGFGENSKFELTVATVRKETSQAVYDTLKAALP